MKGIKLLRSIDQKVWEIAFITLIQDDYIILKYLSKVFGVKDNSHQRKVLTQCVMFFSLCLHTPGRRQSKMPILSRNVDQKSIETGFSIAICCPTGNNGAICCPTGNNGNKKHCFYLFLIRVCWLLIMFSIAAYPMCYIYPYMYHSNVSA